MTAPEVYRFGQFRLDPAARELWRGDEELTLPPKAFACLLYLVENRGRAIGREELIKAVWKHGHLTDSTLDQTIFLVRRTLGDPADAPRHVKTVRGFGYHWVASTEIFNPQQSGDPTRLRAFRRWLAAALLLMAVATIWSIVQLRPGGEPAGSMSAVPPVEGRGDIVLVLPVAVDDASGQGWIRLGAMELIAERLRAAGQAVVPAETVIVLMDRWPGAAETTEHLTSATGARLLIDARAEQHDGAWRVSLTSRGGDTLSPRALGQAGDVLEAARIAADRMALSLGLTPAPEPDAEPGLNGLVQQLQAAILAGQREVARELVDGAPTELRTHPEVRFQLARLDLYSQDLRNMDAAEAALESLLSSPAVQKDAVFHSRVLVALGGVFFVRGDDETAERLLLEAADLLGPERRPDRMCDIWNNLGLLAIRRGDYASAREHLVQGRVACESVGNLEGVANADQHLGGIGLKSERYDEAAFYFGRAAEDFAAYHSIDGELRARTNTLIALLEQFDLAAAAGLERRVGELLGQATAPPVRAYAEVARMQFLFASGQMDAARQQLERLLQDREESDNRYYRLESQVLGAELDMHAGDYASAAGQIQQVLEETAQGGRLQQRMYGRVWLAGIRTYLALADLDAAVEVITAMADWAAGDDSPSATVYAALAQAEKAAIEGRDRAAAEAFERALSLARDGRLPRPLLQVAERYVDWLLTGADSDANARALVVASHVASHADRNYGAALLELRVAHAVGATTTWRTALERVRSLAGEHEIPEYLLSAPRADRRVAGPQSG